MVAQIAFSYCALILTCFTHYEQNRFLSLCTALAHYKFALTVIYVSFYRWLQSIVYIGYENLYVWNTSLHQHTKWHHKCLTHGNILQPIFSQPLFSFSHKVFLLLSIFNEGKFLGLFFLLLVTIFLWFFLAKDTKLNLMY